MTPFELNEALKGMVCLVDTREQDTPSLRARLRSIGAPVERRKLDFGDYSARFDLPGGGAFSLADKVCIERKMNLDELCQCFFQSRARFKREFERAKAAGGRIYLLVEGGSWEDIYAGKYRSHASSASLVASLLAFLARYDCKLIFCNALTTGRLIHDILYREGKERMEALNDGDGRQEESNPAGEEAPQVP